MSDDHSQSTPIVPPYEPADIILHYLTLMKNGVLPVVPTPETPSVGAERDALMRLASDTRKGNPVTREDICEVCGDALRAMERLAFALAGAIMRGDAFKHRLQESP